MPHNYVEIIVISGLDMLILFWTYDWTYDMYGTIPVFVRQEDSAAWKW